jgi:25S rRNA (uracil2843-N3)-methyltransferase
MGPKSKKHPKGRPADKPKASPNTHSSHLVVQSADLPNVAPKLQQWILNIFRDALPVPADSNLKQVIQQVKGHLYDRNFGSAFGSEEFLYAYALRWSASRALAYADIFVGLGVKESWLKGQHVNMQDLGRKLGHADVLCIGGGGGAEVVALAAIANMLSLSRLSITVVDMSDWSLVLGKLATGVTEPPILSQYASAAKRDNNQALLDRPKLHLDFKKQDILNCTEDEIRLLVADASLVTLMFTLNELFSTSTAKTSAFLLTLTNVMKPESRLLVVDSPGSYSEVTLGKDHEPKQYPMKWLLDHTLQQLAGSDSDGTSRWTKHLCDDSRWFRINEEKMRYPIELENMRYQIHVYQRGSKTVTLEHE